MLRDNRSFFEKLTGSTRMDEEITNEEPQAELARSKGEWLTSDEEGQLTVDVFQTPDEIIIQSTVAGVKPDEMDVSITQDMVTIKGKRQRAHEVTEKDFFYRELYWGTFSRSILLPQEVDADAAIASLKNGLLTVRLPKLDKSRTQKLKVKME
ncbi:Hsp20/alpha crystallin family protein [Candidatus Giovannonibacteria bacterium]|nr:Hsp20/alpha crystallin family protein [Candidatus Giovannonibacteria bacterium]